MGQMVEDRHLRPALLSALKGKGVTELNETRVTDEAPDQSGVTVTLDTGKTLRARLLIGADGKSSATAQRAGIKRMGWTYGQTSLVTSVAHELPHSGIAHQFFMPAGPLAILPLTDNRASIVWTESEAEADRIQSLSLIHI